MLKSLSFEFLVANIKATYYQCKQYPSLYQSGLTWYQKAHNQAVAIAARHNTRIDTVCGIISALSPRNRWERNLIDAELCIKVARAGGDINDFKVGTFNRNKENALLIAEGNSPLTVLNGNKTRAFYANLHNPRDPHTVAVDGHAIHIALGKLAPLHKAPALSDKMYSLFARAYQQATREINVDSLE